MILISSGEFLLGEGEAAHPVHVDAFYMDEYEVTNARYKRYLEATRYPKLPAHWKDGTHPADEAEHPVVYVDWYEATAYCKWLGKRLPTEVEWEKAARGTDQRKYAWGNTFDKRLGNVGGKGTMPVGQFESGKSPYGLHDMTGNVWEWTSTLLKPYPYNPHDGREDVKGQGYRVLRGGAFTVTQYFTRAARRGDGYPTEKDDSIGFRCAKDVSPR